MSYQPNVKINLSYDWRLAATRFATKNQRPVVTRTDLVWVNTSLLLLLLMLLDVVTGDMQNIIATLELTAAVAAHRQMLDHLDDAWLK